MAGAHEVPGRSDTSLWGSLFKQVAVVSLALLLIHQGLQYAYLKTFQGIERYDDEGFFMLSVREFLRGGALYDDVYSQYGPAYHVFKLLLHGPTGLPLTHDVNRLTSIVFWIGTAVACSVFTWRVTASLLLAVLVYAQSVIGLAAIGVNPGSPQELCFLLLAGILFFTAPARSKRAVSLSLIAVGALAAALLLTKVNVGVYLLISLTLGVLALAARRRALVFANGVLSLAAVALPPVVMWEHLGTTWGLGFALVISLSLVSVLPFLFSCLPKDAVQAGHVLALLGGFVVSLVVICMVVVARGTSLTNLVDGILLQHLGFSKAFSSAAPATAAAIPWAIAAAAFALTYAWNLRRPGTRTLFDLAVTWLKLLFGALVIYASLQDRRHELLGFVTPFLWLILVPPLGSKVWTSEKAQPRVLLLLIAILQVTAGYPVWGSRPWTFLFVPLGAVCMADAWRDLGRVGRTLFEAHPIRRGVVLAVLIASVAAIYHRKADVAGEHRRYQSLTPLGLPGSDRIRLPRNMAAVQRWVAHNLRAHASTFLSMPGLGSYYFWCEMDPPTGLNAGAWVLLLDEEAQARIVHAARRHDERLCAVFLSDGKIWLGEGEIPPGPLVSYLQDDFVPARECAGYELLVRSGRAPSELDNYLLSGRASFTGRDDSLPLPRGMISRRRLSIRGWMRTSAPGVLLGYQVGGTEHRAPILYVGTDGQLHGQFWTGEIAAMSSRTRVDDGSWHHVALVGRGRQQTLYVDGVPEANGQGRIAHWPMKEAQIGAGFSEGWPQMEPGVFPFIGELGDVVLEDHPLEPEEVEQFFQRGPPTE
jgi:hypothetical protein